MEQWAPLRAEQVPRAARPHARCCAVQRSCLLFAACAVGIEHTHPVLPPFTLQSCPDYGWCAPPEAGRTSGAPLHHPAHLPPQEAELAELASRALRVLLGSDSVLLHAQLRLAVLGRGEAADGAAASRRCGPNELA